MDVTRYKRPVKTRRNLKTIDLGLSKVAAEVSSTQSFAEAKPRVAVKPRQTVSDFISKPNPDSVKNIENADEPRAEVLNANNQNNPHTTDDQTIIKDQNTLINMDLPGEESEVKELKVSAKDSRAVIARRWILRSLLVLFVLIIGVGGFLFSNGYIKIHKAFKGSAPSVASLKEDVLPELLKGKVTAVSIYCYLEGAAERMTHLILQIPLF